MVFNEKAANGSHKKKHKISDIGQISSTLSPLMEIVTKNNEGFIILELFEK